jgi:GNAT superfamily N-acetyltransferase
MQTQQIRPCTITDLESICVIVNDAAEAYRGIIPIDRWKEPYMTLEELCHEIGSGVAFWGCEEDGELMGVMGLQNVQDVSLIRHAYVRTAKRGKGIGGRLLHELRNITNRPILLGTWADASWAVKFYEKHGFVCVSPREKQRLLKTYWSVPERQIETSVVLADPAWFSLQIKDPH